MSELSDHFSDNAEVDEKSCKIITQNLINNSAEMNKNRRSTYILRSIPRNETPVRISEPRFFQREHGGELRQNVKNNTDIKSFSRCEACHHQAEKGSYNERQIQIPSFGRW